MYCLECGQVGVAEEFLLHLIQVQSTWLSITPCTFLRPPELPLELVQQGAYIGVLHFPMCHCIEQISIFQVQFTHLNLITFTLFFINLSVIQVLSNICVGRVGKRPSWLCWRARQRSPGRCVCSGEACVLSMLAAMCPPI